VIIDDDTCTMCDDTALPYDPETDEAYCAPCKMIMLTYVSLDDYLLETDPLVLQDDVMFSVHRGDITDDGRCYFGHCRRPAIPRHRHHSRWAVINLCTRHAVNTMLPHLETAERDERSHLV